jgi:hypothetical protein
MAKFIFETIAGVAFFLVFLPMHFAAMVFLLPLREARAAWSDGHYFKSIVFLTLGSWPAWLVAYAVFNSN